MMEESELFYIFATEMHIPPAGHLGELPNRVVQEMLAIRNAEIERENKEMEKAKRSAR